MRTSEGIESRDVDVNPDEVAALAMWLTWKRVKQAKRRRGVVP